MPHFQATMRYGVGDHEMVVDRVGKVFSAPSLEEAEHIATEQLPANMTLIKVVELIEGREPSVSI